MSASNSSYWAAIQKKVHRYWALNRRIQILSEHIAKLLPESATLLDVGCGSGEIAREVMRLRPGIVIDGIDVLARQATAIPVATFDGERIPYSARSYDFVTLIDVLHHTNDPMVLLREAFRVARRAVIVKDHRCPSSYHHMTMSFTDWFANGGFGVPLPFNFWSDAQWQAAWSALDTAPAGGCDDIRLYSAMSRLIFPSRMDFLVTLPVPSHTGNMDEVVSA